MPEPVDVREYFPGVREACLRCPALVTAACRLRKEEAEAAMQTEAPVPAPRGAERAVTGLGRVLHAISEVVVSREHILRAMRAVAWVMQETCTSGTVVLFRSEVPDATGMVTVMLQCGSVSGPSYFVPPVSAEEPVIPHQR